jgi:hypothetical protein
VCHTTNAHEAAVQRAPGIPHALVFRGEWIMHNSGASCRGIAEAYFLVIARSEANEAIHSFFLLLDGLLRFARNDGPNSVSWLFEN